MKAVILAGGRGTRLAPVTHGAVPKPMAELLGAPMLEHIVALLKRCGFRDLCCTTACLPEQIERYFGDGSGFGVRMQYRREDRALGTAGAVKNCEDFIAGENALIISGDAACDFDLRALWNEHRRAHAAVTMALYPHEAPLPYGLAVTDGEGWVRSFIEKPAWERVVTDLVNTGIYVLSPEVLRFIPADTPFDFARDLFPRLMSSGRGIRGVPMEGYWRDIGDPGSYYRANLDAWEGRLRLPEQIERYFGDGSGFGVRMQYRREDRALGTAGAVKNCEDFIAGENALIISGDAACDFDLRALWNEHRRAHAAVTMALYPHEAPLPYGLAVTDGEGWVRSFIEKPAWERVVTDLVNTGIYVLSPEVLRFIPADTPFDFARDLFPRLMSSGRGIRGVPMEGYWRDIGDPGSYYRANLDAWEGRLRLPEQRGGALERAPEAFSERARYACRVYCGAPHRARLMRALTAGLMEAGADLTDGLTVRTVPGGVHIAPCADRAALCIESDSPDTARRFEALVRDVERRVENETGGSA